MTTMVIMFIKKTLRFTCILIVPTLKSRRRNICDNLFVVNLTMNEDKYNKEEVCDKCVYDVKKCHDSLWLHECINDVWEAGVQDD